MSQRSQRLLLLDYVRSCSLIGAGASNDVGTFGIPQRVRRLPANSLQYKFLNLQLCRRSWCKLTWVSPGRLQSAVEQVWKGETDWNHVGFQRLQRVRLDILGATWGIIESLRDRSPLRDVGFDDIILPFHHKILLFRMLQEWYDARNVEIEIDPFCGKPPLLDRPPNLQTFYVVLRMPEFSKVRFHRKVEMGRCPVCQLLAYKCMSAPIASRAEWQRLAAKHQWLQRAQKNEYARDRGILDRDCYSFGFVCLKV